METQTCNVCNTEKPVSDFSFRNDSQKYRTNCKECRSKNMAAKRYGTTVERVNQMYEEQEGKCKICSTEMKQFVSDGAGKETANIDHCHTTGEVRGLLCGKCNKGIGLLNDDPDLLQKAIRYLNVSHKRND